MTREIRSARVDAELLDRLEELARQRLVPTSFTEQVDAGLRLLVRQAEDALVRRSSELVAADRDRAERDYRKIHRGPS